MSPPPIRCSWKTWRRGACRRWTLLLRRTFAKGSGRSTDPLLRQVCPASAAEARGSGLHHERLLRQLTLTTSNVFGPRPQTLSVCRRQKEITRSDLFVSSGGRFPGAPNSPSGRAQGGSFHWDTLVSRGAHSLMTGGTDRCREQHATRTS